MARSGNPGAFETIVDRYQGRLLGFCRQMLGSTEDAEDVLQEVFVNAYRAMLADEREINLRPWLYRIARNRCLNHLRKPTADAQESMDMVPEVEAASTAEKVHNREEFRQLLSRRQQASRDPALGAAAARDGRDLLRGNRRTRWRPRVPSVKSLLVRARISLAEASQARQLTCGEVRLELAEAAEGLRKVSGAGPPPRPRVRGVRRLPLPGPLQREGAGGALPGRAAARLQGLHRLQARPRRGCRRRRGAAAAGAGAGAGAAPARSAASAPRSAAAARPAASARVGGAIGTKAVAGVVTAAVLTAGAVEVKQQVEPGSGRPGQRHIVRERPQHRPLPRDRPGAAAPQRRPPSRRTPATDAAPAPVRRRRRSKHPLPTKRRRPPDEAADELERPRRRRRPSEANAAEASTRRAVDRRNRRRAPAAAAAPSSSPSAALRPPADGRSAGRTAAARRQRTAARRTAAGGSAAAPRSRSPQPKPSSRRRSCPQRL